MSLLKAIKKLRPNSEVVIYNDDYSTVIWHNLEGEAPTQAEIDVAIEQVKADEAAEAVSRIAEAEAKALARTSALAKLAALGLSADEIASL
jgi:hypothetical protein